MKSDDHNITQAGRMCDVRGHVDGCIAFLRTQGLDDDQIQEALALALAKERKGNARDATTAKVHDVNTVTTAEELGRTVNIDWIVKKMPLIDQSPFKANDLRSIDFGVDAAVRMNVLSAPFQSGKSPAMGYLTLKAISEGCWVLLLLNLNTNQAIDGLVRKFSDIFERLGIHVDILDDSIFRKPNKQTFNRACTALRTPGHCNVWICKADEDPLGKLAAANLPHDVWQRCIVMIDEVHCFFTLADVSKKKAEINLLKLLFANGAAPSASNAVDEEEDAMAMRVRSVVLSDATDGDVPHVLQHMSFTPSAFRRYCADEERLKARGYVSVADFQLFVAPGMQPLSTPASAGQRYGKDFYLNLPFTTKKPTRKRVSKKQQVAAATDGDGDEAYGADEDAFVFPVTAKPKRKRVSMKQQAAAAAGAVSAAAADAAADGNGDEAGGGDEDVYVLQLDGGVPMENGGVSGKEFAVRVERAHFEPNLLAFCVDAFESNGGQGRFMLELTSPNKSEATYNSVEHHAQAMARLFPDVLALAEYGAGCFRIFADGTKEKFDNHVAVYEQLQAPPDAPFHNKPKYLISNLGYGSITYSFPGAPITHLYIGFRSTNDNNNLLVKAQGAGRAAGYVAADLAACGVERVSVLCTPRDFEELRHGLRTFIGEAYAQYPNHSVGTYSTRTVREYSLGHRNNPKLVEARSLATVPPAPDRRQGLPLQPPTPEQGGQAAAGAAVAPALAADRTALYNSVERALDVELPTNDAILFDERGIIASHASAHEGVLRLQVPEAKLTTQVVFLTCADMAAAKEAIKSSRSPTADTSIGKALSRLQAYQNLGETQVCTFIRPKEEATVTAKKCNSNPAHFGKKGGKRPQLSYQAMWTYDPASDRFVGIVRKTSFFQLSLPFVYHKFVFDNDSGAVSVLPMLVTEAAPKPAKRPRRAAAPPKHLRGQT